MKCGGLLHFLGLVYSAVYSTRWWRKSAYSHLITRSAITGRSQKSDWQYV